MSAHYQHLRADRVLETLDKLQARINARFPSAGLSHVCADLIQTAKFCAGDAASLQRPSYFWRLVSLLLIVGGVAAQIAAFRFLHIEGGELSAPEFVQGLEAAVNLLILFGGAVWFVLTLEERSKRRRALDALHRLRSLAHVIDMHQLTKDPTQLWKGYSSTASSQVHDMTEFELIRYLDYCSEMLSLTGKLAALYMQNMRDPIIIEAVNEIEDLTTSLSRKIWQKIMILQQPQRTWAH